MTPFPIASLSGEHRTLGLALAVALGVAFGFVLERAGVGRATKVVAQFYGRDMTMLRVLFTGIVTAMLGALLLSAAGLLDLPFIQLRYPTFLWPMIVGGIVLGAGIVLAGYCPGTCLVGVASGKLDAVATLGGLVVGALAHAELEGAMGAFPQSGALGSFTLAQWLRLPLPAVAGLVAAVAVLAFLAAGRIERRVTGRGGRVLPARGDGAEAPGPAPGGAALTR